VARKDVQEVSRRQDRAQHQLLNTIKIEAVV
jgi:hypothetical protein